MCGDVVYFLSIIEESFVEREFRYVDELEFRKFDKVVYFRSVCYERFVESEFRFVDEMEMRD